MDEPAPRDATLVRNENGGSAVRERVVQAVATQRGGAGQHGRLPDVRQRDAGALTRSGFGVGEEDYSTKRCTPWSTCAAAPSDRRRGYPEREQLGAGGDGVREEAADSVAIRAGQVHVPIVTRRGDDKARSRS
ncbi:hypothetical protein GCM10023175_29800 [Pseudonocardia xishanensis]|uniref:Uncharacterized protein n=1 Tax=Pseudonocardia xishanensis TaxID=630995 RepID=A0ABP8RRZ4_9PSEU